MNAQDLAAAVLEQRHGDLRGETCADLVAFCDEVMGALDAKGARIVEVGDATSLTVDQLRAFLILQEFDARQAPMPSFRQLSSLMGLKSVSSSHRLMHGLARRGWIRLGAGQHRAVTLLKRLERPAPRDGTRP